MQNKPDKDTIVKEFELLISDFLRGNTKRAEKNKKRSNESFGHARHRENINGAWR